MVKESNDKPAGSPNWWQTAPGIITAIAALMTASGGLLIAMNQVGCFDKNGSKNKEVLQSEKKDDNKTPVTPNEDIKNNTTDNLNTDENKKYPVTLQNTADVNFEGNVYKFVSTQLDFYSPAKTALKFKIRITINAGGVYFNSDFFRLLIDDLKLSPESSTAEWIESFSTKEGEVVFIIPEMTNKVQLQIGDVYKGEDHAVKVSFNLK
jgi:hypothetical protein